MFIVTEALRPRRRSRSRLGRSRRRCLKSPRAARESRRSTPWCHQTHRAVVNIVRYVQQLPALLEEVLLGWEGHKDAPRRHEVLLLDVIKFFVVFAGAERLVQSPAVRRPCARGELVECAFHILNTPSRSWEVFV